MATTTTPTVPIDLLGAVNQLLAAVGQTSVSSLQQADMNLKAQEALEMINVEAVVVQQRGWNFNTEQCYAIDPSVDGSIYLPDNCLQATVTGRSAIKRLGTRGKRLYDLRKSTFNIGETVYLQMVVALEFSDIPAPIRWYIVARSGFRYAANKIPAGATARFTSDVEQKALAWAEDFNETEAGDTMLSASPFISMMRRR